MFDQKLVEILKSKLEADHNDISSELAGPCLGIVAFATGEDFALLNLSYAIRAVCAMKTRRLRVSDQKLLEMAELVIYDYESLFPHLQAAVAGQ